MTEFEFGFDLDAAQKRDEEKYLNKKRLIPFTTLSENIEIRRDRSIGKLQPIPLSQLMKSWQPAEWIVDLFGARGACVLLAGDKGSGKSAFMYRMAESISNGSIFMGELRTVKTKVFIWQADESRNNSQLKIKMMALKGNISFLFNDDEDGNYLDINKLKFSILEEGFEVIFIDSITGLLMGHGVNIKDSEFSKPLYELNNLASQLNVLIIISAHLTKEDRREINMNDILGAGTQGGAVSDIWGLWMDDQNNENFYLKCLGKRNCEKGMLWKLHGNKEDFSFKLVAVGEGDLLPYKRNEYSYKFLNYLMSNKIKMTYKDLSKKINCNEEHARRICIKLFGEGKIQREKINDGVGRPFYKYYY